MRRVSINSRTYALPFSDLLRPLTPRELAELTASIDAEGVLDPVSVYTSRVHGRAVVDGMNRALIAEALHLEVPLADLGEMSDEAARHLAYALNVVRRHLSAEEIEALRKERVERVKAARANGEPLRKIAAREGVSHTQVNNDGRENVNRLTPAGQIDSARRTLGTLAKKADALAVASGGRWLYLLRRHEVPADWPVRLRAVLADLAAQVMSGEGG